MQHKVEELEGALLDAAVAKAEGKNWRFEEIAPGICFVERKSFIHGDKWLSFSPAKFWEHGGPIIERDRITVAYAGDGMWFASLAEGIDPGGDPILKSGQWDGSGPTALVAAMRAKVASKFGDTVELP